MRLMRGGSPIDWVSHSLITYTPIGGFTTFGDKLGFGLPSYQQRTPNFGARTDRLGQSHPLTEPSKKKRLSFLAVNDTILLGHTG